MRTAVLLVFVVTPSAVAAPVPKVAKKPDAESIQGRWVCQTLDTGSGAQPDGETWLVLADGKLSNGNGTLKGHVAVPFTLDPAQSPKRIDIEPAGGTVMVGVYELDGDTLTWCFSQPGQPRPKKLAAKDSTGCRVWKRVVEEKKDK